MKERNEPCPALVQENADAQGETCVLEHVQTEGPACIAEPRQYQLIYTTFWCTQFSLCTL